MTDVNFLPPTFARRAQRRRRVMHETALVAAIALGLGGWLWKGPGRSGDLSRQADDLATVAATVHAQADEAARLTEEKAGLDRRVRARRELAAPIDAAAVLAAVGGVMPPSLALTDLSLTSEPPRAPRTGSNPEPAPPPAPMRVALTGLAPADGDIADFVGRLSQCPAFAGVKLVYTRAVQKEDLLGREFRVELEVPMDCDYRSAGAMEVAHAN